MTYYGYGRVIRGVGGLFTVRVLDASSSYVPNGWEPMPLDGRTVYARGRGALRRRGELLVGDLVRISYDDGSFSRTGEGILPATDGAGIAIDEILPRRSALIRPPMANLELLFVTVAAASPDPIPETVDKMIAIAEHNGIEPVLVVTKSDLAPEAAERLLALYRGAGFSAFSAATGMFIS